MNKSDYIKTHLSALCFAFQEFVDQYGCDCGIIGCKDCMNTKTANSAIHYAEKVIQNDNEKQEPKIIKTKETITPDDVGDLSDIFNDI